MTISGFEHDTSNTIASENDELKHDKHSSDIRDSGGHAGGDGAAPEHGPDTIAAANKELRADKRFDDRGPATHTNPDTEQ